MTVTRRRACTIGLATYALVLTLSEPAVAQPQRAEADSETLSTIVIALITLVLTVTITYLIARSSRKVSDSDSVD